MFQRARAFGSLMSLLGSALFAFLVYVILHSDPGDVSRLMAIAAIVTLAIPIIAFGAIAIAGKADQGDED